MQAEYVVRTEGTANSYGLGEVVSDGVVLFRDGCYGLTWEETQHKLKQLTTPKKAH